jgi:pilus assembly protein CpaE
MRSPGQPASGTASVVVVGVDVRQFGLVRETVGTEAALPPGPISYAEGAAAARKHAAHVVVVGFDGDFEEAIRLAPAIQADNPRTHLVALSAGADPDRIRAAMRAGYREFVVLPDDAELLRQAVHEAMFSEDSEEDAGQVVAFWGSKGGVGTTFLAINMAGELSPVQRVCVVDLDFAMGDVAAFLDLQPNQGLAEIFRNIGRLDERMLAGHVSPHPSKVHVLGQPLDLEQREEPRGDLVTRTLTVVARAYQVVVLDLGASLDEASVTAATLADRLVLVFTPDVPAVKNTWRRIQFLERLGVERERIHLVANRWDRKSAAVSLEDIERNLGRKIDLTVSEDPKVLRSVNEGRLLREFDRKAPAARDIELMVGLVTDGEVEAEPPPKSLVGRLFGL